MDLEDAQWYDLGIWKNIQGKKPDSGITAMK